MLDIYKLITSLKVYEIGNSQAAVKESNDSIENFDTSCFDGSYITEGVTKEYLEKLGISR